MCTFRLRRFLTSTALCAGWILQANATPGSAAMVKRNMGFEENQGQASTNVRFIQHAAGYTVLALDRGLDFRLNASGEKPLSVRMEFAGAGPASRASAQEPLSGRVSYLKGNNPAAWHRNIPTFARVHYENVYPGIAASFYSHSGQLEYDVALQPQADLAAVKLRFSSPGEGIQTTLTSDGDLLLRSDVGDVRFHRPVVYQQSGTEPKQLLAGQFVLRGANEVGFSVPVYDHTKPLVIDPVMTYSSYIGGSGDDIVTSIKQDSEGNIYVAGYTTSTDFPTMSAAQGTLSGSFDAFISKLDPTGTNLIYSTYLGGNSYDACIALALASDGSASLAGFTESIDFPMINAIETALEKGTHAFVAHLDNSGSRLIFATYLGGSGYDNAFGLALGPDQSVYVTGGTTSLDFPVTQGAIQSTCNAGFSAYPCDGDAFVSRFSPTGELIFSTFLGGSLSDYGSDISVDTSGQAYVVGTTSSYDFPLKRAAQREKKGGTNAFLSRISADGTQLILSTYFGGLGSLQTAGMAIDRWHNIYLTGYIFLLLGDSGLPLPNAGLPLVNPFQAAAGGGTVDGFIVKFDPKGRPVYSSYLGGSGNEYLNQVAVDAEGHAFVVGNTDSLDFPTHNPLQAGLNGVTDAFVMEIAASGGSLIYSTYLGGGGAEFGSSITADGAGGVWTAGATTSTDFPLMHPFQPAYAGSSFDGFLTHIAPSTNEIVPATCLICK